MSNVYRFPRRRPPRRPFKRRFRRRVASRNLTIAALLIVALVLAAPSILQVWHGQRGRALPATDVRSRFLASYSPAYLISIGLFRVRESTMNN